MKGLQFDVEMRADGLRIYARLGHEIVGALDVGHRGARQEIQMSTAVIYVVPRWRGQGIAVALQEFLTQHGADAQLVPASLSGA